MMLLMCAAGFILIAWLGRDSAKKNLLASAKFGGKAEKEKARKKAIKQIENHIHNEIGVKIYSSVYLPDLQKGLIACGGAGSGKTASILLPAIYSSIEQGHSLLVYDFKYGDPRDSLAASISAYAVKHDYNLRIFAPGFPESEVCNPLDFLEDHLDGEKAALLAKIMNENMKPSADKGDDPFFTIAGDLLVHAVLLLAKQAKFPDMAQCQKILALSQLKERILASKLSYLTKSQFDQFVSVSKSEKTADSIRGTAQNLFVPFTNPGFSSAFCGQTTIPLDITGKTLLILGMNKGSKQAMAPYIAGILQLLVQRNISFPRENPLITVIDELPTLSTTVDDWLAQNRSSGLSCLLGVQDYGQLENRYGKDRARTIFANAATKAIFAQQEIESAESFSRLLGDTEVRWKQRSKGSSGGKASTNVTETRQTSRLFSAERFSKLKPGKCVLISPGFTSNEEVNIPLLLQIKLTEDVKAQQEWCVKMWNEKLRARLIERSPQPKIRTRQDLQDYAEILLRDREQHALELLPNPISPSGL